jgi:hypothetical protein
LKLISRRQNARNCHDRWLIAPGVLASGPRRTESFHPVTGWRNGAARCKPPHEEDDKRRFREVLNSSRVANLHQIRFTFKQQELKGMALVARTLADHPRLAWNSEASESQATRERERADHRREARNRRSIQLDVTRESRLSHPARSRHSEAGQRQRQGTRRANLSHDY